MNHLDNADSGVMGVFMRLTSPQILTEVIAIACAGLIALAGAQIVKAWDKRNVAAERAEGWQRDLQEGSVIVAPYLVALIVLLLILAIFGGLGFAAHILWIVLIAAVILWLLGFLIGGAEHGMGRRRWYGRW